ncbi:hypothetical protein B0H17DRAFT_1337518, partial [Mycena rosella]
MPGRRRLRASRRPPFAHQHMRLKPLPSRNRPARSIARMLRTCLATRPARYSAAVVPTPPARRLRRARGRVVVIGSPSRSACAAYWRCSGWRIHGAWPCGQRPSEDCFGVAAYGNAGAGYLLRLGSTHSMCAAPRRMHRTHHSASRGGLLIPQTRLDAHHDHTLKYAERARQAMLVQLLSCVPAVPRLHSGWAHTSSAGRTASQSVACAVRGAGCVAGRCGAETTVVGQCGEGAQVGREPRDEFHSSIPYTHNVYLYEI